MLNTNNSSRNSKASGQMFLFTYTIQHSTSANSRVNMIRFRGWKIDFKYENDQIWQLNDQNWSSSCKTQHKCQIGNNGPLNRLSVLVECCITSCITVGTAGSVSFVLYTKRKLARLLLLLLHGANTCTPQCARLCVWVLALHSKEICIHFNIFLLQRVELYQSALFFGLCAVKVRKGLASFRVVDVSSACERACVRSARVCRSVSTSGDARLSLYQFSGLKI